MIKVKINISSYKVKEKSDNAENKNLKKHKKSKNLN